MSNLVPLERIESMEKENKEQFQLVFAAIKALVEPKPGRKKKIGFIQGEAE